MSIGDSSGLLATRNADPQAGAPSRGDVTRAGSDSARYQAVDIGAGAGGGASPSPPPQQGAKQQPAQDGSGPEGDPRPCAYVVTYEQWATAEDERVCPECAPLDGAWFQVGFGPQPPLHDHCRCYRFVVWWDCYQSDGTWEKGERAY
ncbi:MAG TPA: hypothetical protein VHV31_10840 [Nitrolancea sp.]|jgi:hypothetical protein|nr:hypothetical protein [Nitrolancea sp.]